MHQLFSNPADAQAHIAAVALVVAVLSLIVSCVVAFLQWQDRRLRRREIQVPKFESSVRRYGENWYVAKILMRTFNRAKTDAELHQRDLHFHDLRGTAATRFYLAGVLERAIAEIMG